MPPRPLILPLILPAILLACAPAPDFPEGAAANAPFPKIIPTSEIQAQAAIPPTDDGIDDLATRAADLRARAARLRGTSVVDTETEDQMLDALDAS
ncbi:hypothetical protein [uncultured Aliiroseovarius sp.]|uniref:hypothetical protein n=1 Tax=uncultured Aliiroseovarius sp. TaxID=1658783 RepID=UPI0025980667|nr:hypothetical protein [uncultured Aliiroseovarius sp.]